MGKGNWEEDSSCERERGELDPMHARAAALALLFVPSPGPGCVCVPAAAPPPLVVNRVVGK